MDYLWLIFSGVGMGLVAAVPVGPVNIICIRRTFAFGPLNGFLSGLGAALGDGVFAAITGLGLTWIAQLIQGYAALIELGSGLAMVFFGIKTFLDSHEPQLQEDRESDKAGASLLEIVGPSKPAAPAPGEPSVKLAAGRVSGGPWGVAFGSTNLDATVAFLRSAGVEVSDPTRAVQGGRITGMPTALGGIQLAFMGE